MRQWVLNQEAQYEFMFEKAHHLFLAKKAGDEDDFYNTFFKEWFERWPITGENKVAVMEMVKKVSIHRSPV